MKRWVKIIRKKILRFARYFRTPSAEERELHALYTIFEASPEGDRIIEWRDVRKLFHIIKQLQPKRALELGTGIGAASAVMAYALPAAGMLTSIEQTEKCVTIARALIPHELQKKIQVVLSEVHAFAIPNISPYLYFSGYKTIPIERGPFDFVLVDGPDQWEENGQLVALPNGDLITLIPYLAPGCMVYVDGRKSALKLYRRFCNDYFSLVSETDWYSVLKRTEVPAPDFSSIHFSDTKKELRGNAHHHAAIN